MESHKGIFERVIIFALDFCLIHIIWNGIINIKQGDSVLAYDCSDVLADCTVDIHLAGYRNPLRGQTTVHITRYKTKLCLEGRPAFPGNRHVFSVSLMITDPVFERQLILRQFGQNLRFFIACSQFLFHLFYDFPNPLVSFMFVE